VKEREGIIIFKNRVEQLNERNDVFLSVSLLSAVDVFLLSRPLRH
jgi:hypothetical protein